MIIDLCTKDGYSIAGAIRGPDFDGKLNTILKHIFTARIREIVSPQCMGDTRGPRIGISHEGVMAVLHNCPGGDSEGGPCHYLGHVLSALDSITDIPEIEATAVAHEIRALYILAGMLYDYFVGVEPIEFVEVALKEVYKYGD